MLKDKNLSDNQKVQILRTLQEQFYAKHGKDLVTKEELGALTRLIGAIPIMNDIARTGQLLKIVKVAGKAEAVLNDGTRVALNATEVSKYEESVKTVSNKSSFSTNLPKIDNEIKALDYKEVPKLDYTLAGGYKASEINKMSVEDFSKLGLKDYSTGKGIARFMIGNEEDAYKFFKSRISNISEVEIKKAYYKNGNFKGIVEIAKDIYGNKIEYRRFSSTKGSFPTIDVFKTINGVERKVAEIKFKE